MADHQVIINGNSRQLVPHGYCACGCGQKTKKILISDSGKRYIKGRFFKYLYGHNRKLENHPLWKGGKIISTKGYIEIKYPDHPRANQRGYVKEHILICEKALGKFLPPGVEPHHFDHDRANNINSNLVLCQDRAYHILLHQRERAYKACGHAHWMKCRYCKQYDDPSNMIFEKNRPNKYHKVCSSIYHKIRRQNAKKLGTGGKE